MLENYPFPTFGYTYFNYNFDLLIDPVLDSQLHGLRRRSPSAATSPISRRLPGRVPDLPIDGYMSSAWYDPAHGGEGLMVQIYDNADDATRTLFAAWYTYDANGIPFWLSVAGRRRITARTRSRTCRSTTTRAAVSPAISAASRSTTGAR